MSSRYTFPALKNLNSDALFHQFITIANHPKGWIYEYDALEKNEERYDKAIAYIMIACIIALLTIVAPLLRRPIILAVVLIIATVFIVRRVRYHRMLLNRTKAFMHPRLALKDSIHQPNSAVICRLKHTSKANMITTVEQKEVLAKLACYEIVKSNNGTSDFYAQAELWSSDVQEQDMKIVKNALVAQFSFVLPHNAQASSPLPAYEEYNVHEELLASIRQFDKKGKMDSEELRAEIASSEPPIDYRITGETPKTSIWWLVEIYQPVFKNHFYIPVHVQSHQRVS